MTNTSDENVEPSVFTKIINGEFPGRFVWRDDRVVAFLTIAPMKPGHTLVVPIQQIDKWTDVPANLWEHLSRVQLHIGQALQDAFSPTRVGSIIAGLEVPHCHVHLVPIDSEADLSFAKVDHSPKAEDLDAAAAAIRDALIKAGHSEAASA